MRDIIRRRVLPIIVGSALFVTPVAACVDDDNGSADVVDNTATQTAVNPGGPVVDYETLLGALRVEGLTVGAGDEISQPFLEEEGQVIDADGEPVQVYTYPSADAAGEAAQRFSPDASTFGSTVIDWVDEPHVYQAGRLLAIYVGSDDQVLDALESALGGQVAGAGAVRVAVEPPPATLTADGETQTAVIGTYCWESVCVDAANLVAPEDGLAVPSGTDLMFDFADDIASPAISTAAYPLPEDMETEAGRVTLDQPFPESQSLDAQLSDGTATIGTNELEPGEYVLTVSVNIPNGDVAYNFHVAVE